MKSISKLRHIQESNLRLEKRYLMEQTITLPQTVSDTFTSYDGDSAHRLTGLEKKIDIALEKIYNQGINPKMYDVKLQVVRNGNTFTTSSSLIIDKSDDGKAWTGFATRGSIGYDYVKRADGQIDGSANADGRSLKEKLESGADAVEIIPISNSPITINNVQLKQYFVQFTKSSKPSHASSKPTSEEVMKKFVVSSKDLNTLNVDFKNQVANYIKSKGDINYDVDYFDLSSEDGLTSIAKLDIIPNENGYNRFSILFNPKGKPQESLNNALSKNPGSKLIKDGTITIDNKEYEYHLIGLHI